MREWRSLGDFIVILLWLCITLNLKELHHRSSLKMPPLLYTFRRCPYAIRARLAIKISGLEVKPCEVNLRDKPQALMDCSPKATVPVLQFTDGHIIDESLDIMQWALTTNDPEQWMDENQKPFADTLTLISQNDSSFKQSLDRYKYADRHPEHPASYYREQAEVFLLELNTRLGQHTCLIRASTVSRIFRYLKSSIHNLSL